MNTHRRTSRCASPGCGRSPTAWGKREAVKEGEVLVARLIASTPRGLDPFPQARHIGCLDQYGAIGGHRSIEVDVARQRLDLSAMVAKCAYARLRPFPFGAKPVVKGFPADRVICWVSACNHR